MTEEIRQGQRFNDGGVVYLVRDEGLRDPEDEFYAWLKDEGFRRWEKKGYFGEPCVWVNTGNKLFAPGIPGIKIAEPAGDGPIGVDDFKAIYKESIQEKV